MKRSYNKITQFFHISHTQDSLLYIYIPMYGMTPWLTFKLLLDPVILGKGNEWYSRIGTLGLDFCWDCWLKLLLLPEDPLLEFEDDPLDLFFNLNLDLLSTSIKLNSTFLKSSTTTIISLNIGVSPPYKLKRLSKQTKGPWNRNNQSINLVGSNIRSGEALADLE